MEYSAKDATILSLISAQPSTRLFDRLIEKADDPRIKEVAERIRGAANADNEQPRINPRARR